EKPWYSEEDLFEEDSYKIAKKAIFDNKLAINTCIRKKYNTLEISDGCYNYLNISLEEMKGDKKEGNVSYNYTKCGHGEDIFNDLDNSSNYEFKLVRDFCPRICKKNEKELLEEILKQQ